MDEAILVARCLAGDTEAWEQIVRQFSRRIYNLCYRFTGHREEAEDLTQEVFLRIFRTLKSYSAAQGAFATWLTSVSRNLLIDHYRRTQKDRMTSSLDDEQSHLEEKVAATPPPDRQVARREIGQLLQQALNRLSPELREAVILRDIQELEYREIQVILGVPEGTVKSRINRGRLELARLLKRTKEQMDGISQ